VHLVEDVDLVGRLEWERVDALSERADILDAVVTRGVDPIAAAKMRATEVFPSPRLPAKR
jgi:hypothetical protein